MEKQDLHLGKVKLDSLRIRIPINKVVDYSTSSEPYRKQGIETGVVYTNFDTVDGTFKDMSNKWEQNGIKLSWKKCNVLGKKDLITGRQWRDEYYEIAIHSKMLGFDYFQGITSENLRKIYDFIHNIPQGLRFEWDDFIYASICDVDLCYDVECSRSVLDGFVDRVYALVSERNQRKVDCRKYSSTKKCGLQFMERDKQTSLTPYCKYYDKNLELNERSTQFYQEILGGKLPVNVVRFEVNFRDNEAWRNRIPDFNSHNLIEFLMGGFERFKDYILSVVRLRFIEKRVIMKKHKEIPSPTNFLIDYLTSGSIDAGRSRDWFSVIPKQYKQIYGVSSIQQQRLDEIVQEILNRNLIDEIAIKKLEHNDEVDSVGRQLGVWE